MKNFNTKIDGSEKTYTFECYENTEIIKKGDVFIFFFGGIADVQKPYSDAELVEINPNDKIPDLTKIDFVSGFWKNCYKIKNTDFNISNL